MNQLLYVNYFYPYTIRLGFFSNLEMNMYELHFCVILFKYETNEKKQNMNDKYYRRIPFDTLFSIGNGENGSYNIEKHLVNQQLASSRTECKRFLQNVMVPLQQSSRGSACFRVYVRKIRQHVELIITKVVPEYG